MNAPTQTLTPQRAFGAFAKPLGGLVWMKPLAATAKLESRNTGKIPLPCRFSALTFGSALASGIKNVLTNKGNAEAFSGFPVCRMKSRVGGNYWLAALTDGGCHEL